MKDHISTMLITIVLSSNIGDLNTAGNNQGSPSQSPDRQTHLPGPSEEKPGKTIPYMRRTFGVWYHPEGNAVSEVRLIAAKNIIPDDEYRRKHDIQTRYVDKENVRFAVYITAKGKILGAQYAPKARGASGSEINISGINQAGLCYPNPSNPDWSFIYEGREVGVWDDSVGRPRAVGLVPTNIIPTDEDRKKFTVQTQMVHQQGIFFLVHALPNGKILGVELAPRWNPPY